MNYIGNLIHKAKYGKGLNILCQATHEETEFGLTSCFPQHTWYCLYSDNTKTWNNTFRPCPNNYIILKDGKIPTEVNIDCVISQNKAGQFSNLKPITNHYKLPFISFEHTYPYLHQWKKSQLIQLKMMAGDINLFISENSREAWGWNKDEADVIEHYIDTNEFKPDDSLGRNPHILTVCNQFSKPVRFDPCGFPVWQKIIGHGTKEELPWKHLGDDPGFSLPAKNTEELIKEYKTSQIFLNTSLLSPIPHSLLEAAACECPIVSTKTCAIPDIFTHGLNALLSNDVRELREFCVELLQNEDLRRELGKNARKMIQARFNRSRYIEDWEKIWDKVRNF